MQERRNTPRKKFSFYMRVLEDETEQPIGHLVEISRDGFRLETSLPLPLEREYRLHMELTPDLSDRLFMFFSGKVKWCKPDSIMPNICHVGFQMTGIGEGDQAVYQRLLEMYGE
ncbi:MAG: hypothetical protein HFACDABA_01081 [Anaerolineales bacterium]|nr:hypothetical protein [Anaerolineales bacterium]